MPPHPHYFRTGAEYEWCDEFLVAHPHWRLPAVISILLVSSSVYLIYVVVVVLLLMFFIYLLLIAMGMYADSCRWMRDYSVPFYFIADVFLGFSILQFAMLPMYVILCSWLHLFCSLFSLICFSDNGYWCVDMYVLLGEF